MHIVDYFSWDYKTNILKIIKQWTHNTFTEFSITTDY